MRSRFRSLVATFGSAAAVAAALALLSSNLVEAAPPSTGPPSGIDAALWDAAPTPDAGPVPTCPISDPNPDAAALQGAISSKSFAAGSIIIPMDMCYQRPAKPQDWSVELALSETYSDIDPTVSITDAGCGAKDTGVLSAYAIVHRLIEDGIKVSWAIRAGGTDSTNKQTWGDWDFTITAAATSPVFHMDHDGNITDIYTALPSNTIAYSGAPFIISADQATAAIDLIKSYEDITTTCTPDVDAFGNPILDPITGLQTETCVDTDEFDAVDFHIAQVSFNAPVFKTIGEMPKLAVIDCTTNPDDGFSGCANQFGQLQQSLDDVAMTTGVKFWDYVSFDDVLGNRLVTGGYGLAWLPAIGVDGGGDKTLTSDEELFFDKLEAYVAQGGNLVAQDESIHSLEGYGEYDVGSEVFTVKAEPLWSSDAAHSDGGLCYNFASSTYGNNSTTQTTGSEDYSDPASQWGGGTWLGIGGAKYDWTARCDRTYLPGTRRMIYTTENPGEEIEFAAWRYYKGDSTSGRSFYLGGYNWRKNTHTGFRLLMNTILVTASDFDPEWAQYAEASRADTIIATIDGIETQVLGTFDVDVTGSSAPVFATSVDMASFEFPHVTGHIRALNVETLTDPEAITDYHTMDEPEDGSPNPLIFDAENYVKTMTANTAGTGCNWPAEDDGCRRVFSYYYGSSYDGQTRRIPFAENYLYALLYGGLGRDENWNYIDDFTVYPPPNTLFLLNRVVAGKKDSASASGYSPALGGVDRSTAAVIGNSPTTGNDRPTMIYVGARDGMLHAICAEVKLYCGYKGQELWAFMPQGELVHVKTNTTRFDGSPRVADVFADFDNDGDNEYKTVLAYTTGNSYPSSMGAIDITDPSNPNPLWEDFYMYQGADLSMGPVVGWNGFTTMVFAQTMNWAQHYKDTYGYTDAPTGFYLYSRQVSNGYWGSSNYFYYPVPREDANMAVPSSAIPGGVTLYSSTGGIVTDRVVVPSLWGAVYQFEAGDLYSTTVPWRVEQINYYGNIYNWWHPGPIFEIDRDYHPIGAGVSIYRNRETTNIHGVAVTGGYHNTQDTSAAMWSPDDVEQFALSFPLDTTETIVWDPGPPPGDDCTTNCTWNSDEWGIKIDFGPGNRAYSAALIAGNEILVTTDRSSVNADDFGSSQTASGLLLRQNLSEPTASPTVITMQTGAGGIDMSTTLGVIGSSGGSGSQVKNIVNELGGELDTNGGGAVGGYVGQTANRFLWLRTK